MSTDNTHFGPGKIRSMLDGCRKVFFTGIGGVSMSSLALLTHLQGFPVSGSDRTASPITEKLKQNGITVYIGHNRDNIAGCGLLVYTVAISPDNPEYTAAKSLGIPCVSRADYLGYIMMSYPRRFGISGMHGKSTCTSMCASVFMAADVDPTVVSGADYPPMGGYYRIGKGRDFVFEACEYMDSFLDFNPTDAVILNVELEHVDYFGSLDSVIRSFGRFASLTGENGSVIVNADDENALAAVRGYKGRIIGFGIEKETDYCARDIVIEKGKPSFSIYRYGELFCHVRLSVPGMHNIYNALATAAVADRAGIPAIDISRGLGEYSGARRRMEYRGRLNGAEVYDDYGHHPTEIASTLNGAREMCGPDTRLVCAFQPHTYSRTSALFGDFVRALSVADRVILAPVYAAREKDDLGVSSELLAAAIGKKASAVNGIESLGETLKAEITEKDLLVIMGAGDIENVTLLPEIRK